MLRSILGHKVGMTQLFNEERQVIPVTVIDCRNWYVTQLKTNENDGYVALQLGRLKKRFQGSTFNPGWLKKKAYFFEHLREVRLSDEAAASALTVGKEISFDQFALEQGAKVAVSGQSRGLGFQGVVKRHNFAGGPKSHGSNFHRAPGSIGNMCSQGKVLKGKKLPGHTGARRVTSQGLTIARIDAESGCLFVKGAVPGKKNSLLEIHTQG